jgi:hypothetical protein
MAFSWRNNQLDTSIFIMMVFYAEKEVKPLGGFWRKSKKKRECRLRASLWDRLLITFIKARFRKKALGPSSFGHFH